MSLFPLRKITEGQLQQLSRALWSWPTCGDCDNRKTCATECCPFQQSKRLMRYFEYYKDITASYESDIGSGEQPALRSHEDLFQIIVELKSDPTVSHAQLLKKLFNNRTRRRPPPVADQERAINLAVRVMSMVNCSAERQPSGLLEHGAYRVPWRSDVIFSQFITDIFPVTDHPGLNDDPAETPVDIKSALMAKKLKKRAGLKLRPTDDLRSHLKLDRNSGVVEIYHHTAYLKEHLRLTKDQPRNSSMSDSLKLGALPRQLALETLDSLQKILFPLSDPKSRSLLLSLISGSSFDPNVLRFESASIRNADEKDIAYYHLGARLADLYDEMENPKPRGWVEKWLERKSGARYVMMATLIGVVIAIVLGMASLAVGGYQAWIGYQQWQHPVGSGSG